MPTKPVIQYLDSKRPIEITNGCLVRKKIDKTTYVNWMNKAEFTNYVDQLYVNPQSDTYVDIICSCSKEYAYTTSADVPATNLVCACGRQLITYGS
jgi:hypothetical protein